MEENINIEEQSASIQPSVEEDSADSSNNSVEIEIGHTNEAERDVPIGKFDSVEHLLNAYEHLQAEFTRKSQKLADLEREKASEEPSTEQKQNEAFRSFLLKNQNAVFYADELKSRVKNTENGCDEKSFENAWAELLYEKLSSKDKAKDPLVQNFVLSDDDLTNFVVKNYVKQIQGQKTPIVMASNNGEKLTKPAPKRPDSFESAKKMAIDLFS